MAENVPRQTLQLLVRPTWNRSLRYGSMLRYTQRGHTTAAGVAQTREPQSPTWTPHTVPPSPAPSSEVPAPRPRLLNLRAEPKPFSSFLTDSHSREHNYLRISVTERCNLRCVYCMPEKGVPLSPQAQLLTTPEIVHLSSVFVNQGVNKIRLTGGEPTVRKDIVDLMRQIGQLRSAGLKELCLTTNGISLHRKLDTMAESGLTGVNLSLDTLDPYQFTIMTRRNGHDAVMKSISRILEMNKLGAGIKLKINCVVMRGLNEREILPFVEMGREKDLEVRFIEYMPFDGNNWSKGKMLSFKEMLALIRQKYPDVHSVQDHPNDTSKTYKVPGFAGRIGFITSMTHNFCGSCNRLRITGDGNLKVCLFGNAEVSLRDILRESNNGHPIDAEAMEAIKQIEMNRQEARPGSIEALGPSESESRLLEVIGMAVKRKKAKHAGMGELENMKNRPMILIDNMPPIPNPPHFASGTLVAPIKSSLQHRMRQKRTSFPVPLHLLYTTSPIHGQRRLISHQQRWRRETDDMAPATGIDVLSSSARTFKPLDSSPLLAHLTESGSARMVSITHKSPTKRSATAIATILFSNAKTYSILRSATLKKGDALAVARIAGIMAAKKTSDLIPLAHPGIGITGVNVDIDFVRHIDHGVIAQTTASQDVNLDFGGVSIMAKVECEGKTGVEMEALSAATVAGLTVYDMCKGIDKGMVMEGVRVIEKRGGKSGNWRWDAVKGKVMKRAGEKGTSMDDGEWDEQWDGLG